MNTDPCAALTQAWSRVGVQPPMPTGPLIGVAPPGAPRPAPALPPPLPALPPACACACERPRVPWLRGLLLIGAAFWIGRASKGRR